MNIFNYDKTDNSERFKGIADSILANEKEVTAMFRGDKKFEGPINPRCNGQEHIEHTLAYLHSQLNQKEGDPLYNRYLVSRTADFMAVHGEFRTAETYNKIALSYSSKDHKEFQEFCNNLFDDKLNKDLEGNFQNELDQAGLTKESFLARVQGFSTKTLKIDVFFNLIDQEKLSEAGKWIKSNKFIKLTDMTKSVLINGPLFKASEELGYTGRDISTRRAVRARDTDAYSRAA